MSRTDTTCNLSQHGRMRCQQRGIPAPLLAALLDLADCGIRVGGGCEALSLSRRGARRLRQGGYPATLLERLDGATAILSPDGVVVTVLHAQARRYRRAWR